MPAETIIAITRQIHFWPTMRFLTRFQRDLSIAKTDPDRQLALLNQWFSGSPFAARAEPWLRQSNQRVLFSEQQLFAFQRLVVLNARDSDVELVDSALADVSDPARGIGS
jgi:hypothetical protein